MAETLDDTIARLRGAWMAGGLAHKHAPADWNLPENPKAAERALAAIAGQALHAVFRPIPGGALTIRDPLPPLALPPVPDAHRPRLRRILAAHKSHATHLLAALHFLEQRGHAMHPADYLPARGAEIPALYTPWLAWVCAGAPPPKPQKPRTPDPVAAAELAAMLEIETTGLIRRRRHLAIKKLKTAAQTARRRELFGQTDLSSLAAALQTPAEVLLDTAPAGAAEDILQFTTLVAATGTPAQQRALLMAILAEPEGALAPLKPLAAALTRQDTAAALPRILARDDSPNFEHSLQLAALALGRSSETDLKTAPAYESFQKSLAEADGREASMAKPAEARLSSALAALGFLASQPAAQSILETCLAAGLLAADPKLDPLHLNLALPPKA